MIKIKSTRSCTIKISKKTCSKNNTFSVWQLHFQIPYIIPRNHPKNQVRPSSDSPVHQWILTHPVQLQLIAPHRLVGKPCCIFPLLTIIPETTSNKQTSTHKSGSKKSLSGWCSFWWFLLILLKETTPWPTNRKQDISDIWNPIVKG